MLSLLFGCGLGEYLWHRVKIGAWHLKQAKQYLLFFAGLNVFLGISAGSIISLEIGIILALYGLVILDYRSNKKQ